MSKRERILLALQVLLGVSAVALYGYVRIYPYRMGATNSGGPADVVFGAVPYWGALILLGFLYLTVLLFGVAKAKPRGRLLGVSLIVAIVASALAITILLPHDYEEGFSQWVAGSIDEKAIVEWANSLPSAVTTANVDTEQWPPAVRVLVPATVEHHPTGIVLQWGVLAAWGTSRKVFIESTPGGGPPDDYHHPWHQIRSGVWYGIQIPG